MNLRLFRETVCAADDYLNDCVLELDVPTEITVEQFLSRVLNLGFLQYSSSHDCLAAKSRVPLALVLPENQAVIYFIGKDEALANFISGNKVEFVFSLSREQRKLYREFLETKRTGQT